MTSTLKLLMAGGLVVLALTAPLASQRRTIKGAYINFAQGFTVTIPKGLEGVTGDQAGPERGVGITLASGTHIAVYGEPNSLEWSNAEEGVRYALAHYCPSSKPQLNPAPVGHLKGVMGVVNCDQRSFQVLLAFRPHGGPIYWLTLDADRAAFSEDERVLSQLASTFKLVAWK